MNEPSASAPAESRAPSDDAPKNVDAAPAAPLEKKPTRERWWESTWTWVVGIVALLCLELFIYGHDGHIRVCVGLQSLTDYSLLDKPRSELTVRQFPFCADRTNLGMYSSSEDAAQAALQESCNRAAVLLKRDRLECLRRENGWTRQVTRTQVPPWDRRLYRQLFWLKD
jgi:hypothetical protein